MTQYDRLFPKESVLTKRTDGHMIYQMDYSEGYGIMNAVEIMPGVLLVFNDFHTLTGFQGERPRPGVVEINHCLRGRYELQSHDGRLVYLGTQDLAISDMGRPPRASVFTLGEYSGISLMIEVDTTARFLDKMMGCGAIDLHQLFERLLWEDAIFIMRTNSRIQHIFLEMYDEGLRDHLPYLKLKTVELLIFLDLQKNTLRKPMRSYCTQSMLQRIKAIEQSLTGELRECPPLEAVAAQHNMSLTTLKKYFKNVYGMSPYAYLKYRRMEMAALLLQTTEHSIGSIALEVGYQNASKFAAAFTEQYGVSPREYRKGAILD